MDVDAVLSLSDNDSLDLIVIMLDAKPHLAASLSHVIAPESTTDEKLQAQRAAMGQGSPMAKGKSKGAMQVAGAAVGGIKRPHPSGEEGQRYSGTIKSFAVEKGFGFIGCPELFQVYGRDTWVHHAQIQHFQPGEMVEFTMALNKEGNPQALELAAATQMGKKAKGKGFGGKAMFQPMMGQEGQRYAGTIKSFAAEKGFGFIECPELFQVYGRDTWLHHAQLQHFQPGEFVEFTMALNKEGNPQALELALPSQMGKKGKGKGTGGKALFQSMQQQSGEGQRYSGTIKSFAEEKGFGYIDCPELYAVYGRDTWLHHAQLQDFQAGMAVDFTMALNKEGLPQALDLTLPGQPGKGWGKSSGGKAAAQGSPMAAWAAQAMLGKSAQPSKGKGQAGKTSDLEAGETPPWLQVTDDTRYSGIVKSFNTDKGFGFIDCAALKEAYGRDTWVHHAQIGSFQIGDSVAFSMALNQQGHPQAINCGAA